jgi:multiple sugar transport system substrate-binding protein
VGMLIDASAGYTYDLASVGGKFPVGAAPDPAGTAGYGAQYINGASLVLFNVGTSAQKRAAWTFMKWLSSPSTNVYWDEHTNYLPLGPEAARLMASFYRTHPAMAASFTPPTHWWYKPRTGTWDAATTAMSAVFDEALRGQIGVTTALRQMSQVGTAYLSGKLRA